MTAPTEFQPGACVWFYTRPAGMNTKLFLAGNADGAAQVTYHVELCGQPDHVVDLKQNEPKEIDISYASAFVSVRNTGYRSFKAWTDV